MTKKAKMRLIKRLIITVVMIASLVAGVVNGITWSKNNPEQWENSVENEGF